MRKRGIHWYMIIDSIASNYVYETSLESGIVYGGRPLFGYFIHVDRNKEVTQCYTKLLPIKY